MKTRHNLNWVIDSDEEHAVGETPEQCAAQSAMDNREMLWCSGGIREARVDRAQEVRPEALRLRLAPQRSVGDLDFRVGDGR